MIHSYSFVQSIAHINDSGTFETSFEVKNIQSTPQRQKIINDTHNNDCDPENLRYFIKEFEKLQAYSDSGNTTPKKFTTFYDNFFIADNTNSMTLGGTPVCSKNNIEQVFHPHSTTVSSPTSTRVSAGQDFDMGCKPLTSFDMHPPLLPSYNVLPPAQHQQQNSAYELTRFLRGSFHIKSAKITHLRRSLSHNENLQNVHLLPAQERTPKSNAMTIKEAQKKNILKDATNQSAKGSTSSSCSLLFPGKATPFHRVWEQSSLRTPRTNKYALKGKQNSSGIHCSSSMITTEGNAFNNTSPDSKQCSNTISSSANKEMPVSTQSEKLITSQSHAVKSWADSFEHLLQEPAGLATFAEFLKMEFSAENIYFWTSCERYRNTENLGDRQAQAKQIFQRFLANGCREPVNLDSHSRNLSEEMLTSAERNTFVAAQKQIFHLMKFDSYQRFIRSDLYKSCVHAEERDQPLPYGADTLDVLLKTNILQNASPKLKKSVSNAEDRRRKIVLPWHRKIRSKSRDRVDLLSAENTNANNNRTDKSSNGLNISYKLNLLSSTLPPQTKAPADASDSEMKQSSKSSLPTSFKAIETGCSLCRVKFSDGATTIVQIKPNETIQQLVERVLEKRALYYKLYDVVIKGRSTTIDLQSSTQELAGEEVEIEQRVTFKMYLPDPKVISVKSKPKKYLYEVVKPILQKYNYELETINVLRRDNQEIIDLSQLVTTVDGLRLQVVKLQSGDSGNLTDYQNDNISMKCIKSNELANEIVMRSANVNSFRSSQNKLDAITNSIFNDIIQDKSKPEHKIHPPDHYSTKSEECDSEASSIFGATNNKKDVHALSMIRLKNKNYLQNSHHYTEVNMSSSNEVSRPIIAKLKAGVKLQVTERVAEKQDELLMSLKTRLDNQPLLEFQDNDNENDQMSAVNLRRVRANLSPVNKTNHINECPLSLEKPQPLPRNSLSNKKLLTYNSNEEINQNKSESDSTTNAANKGPPPLPPKPKVLPTKPSNWGFHISGQTTLQ